MSISSAPSVVPQPPNKRSCTVSNVLPRPADLSIYPGSALRETLATASAMANFELVQADWTRVLGSYQEFADELEDCDPHVCSFLSLAKLIARAPTAAIRQVLRETFYCRQQTTITLGLKLPQIDERMQTVLASANAEWEIILASFPTYSAWLSTIDRLTCSRRILSEAIMLAPNLAIRHALRETFCFRQVGSLITPHEFA